MPIYLVKVRMPLPAGGGGTPDEKKHLVDAPSKAAAERHVAKQYVSEAEIPSPRSLADIAGSGVKVEEASEGAGGGS